MAKYIYDISRLMPGDIIVMRRIGDELSDRIRRSTQSEFSHAMLYVGDSSYIEASNRVVARNPARLLFDRPEDTCVLRVKDEFLRPHTIDAAIYYARDVVGNPYAFADALRMELGRFDRTSADTQICTRLVSKAYAFSGLFLVENIEMCTPQQLQDSKYVEVHRNLLREANDFDRRFSETYDVTDDMVNAIFKLFDSLKPFAEGKIRTIRQLIEHVTSQHQDDDAIAELLKESGYLDVLRIEEEKNRYNYDKDVFIDFYGGNAYETACAVLESNRRGELRFESDCNELIRTFVASGMKSRTLILLIELDKRIIEQHELREKVCLGVMSDPRT